VNRFTKVRSAVVMGLAATTLFLGAGSAIAATPPPGNRLPCGGSSSNCPPAPAPAPSPVPGVQGDWAHTQQPPSYMNSGINIWTRWGWPNWRQGARGWYVVSSTVNPATHQQTQDIVYTGGQYYDGDGRLRAFLNAGLAGPLSENYQGTFQEYNTTIYHQVQSPNVPYRNAVRLVRAIGSGALFWTADHYKTFHYMGYR
jgi:hypothetical protein